MQWWMWLIVSVVGYFAVGIGTVRVGSEMAGEEPDWDKDTSLMVGSILIWPLVLSIYLFFAMEPAFKWLVTPHSVKKEKKKLKLNPHGQIKGDDWIGGK